MHDIDMSDQKFYKKVIVLLNISYWISYGAKL